MGTQDSLAVGTESLPSEFGLTDAPEPFSGRELEVVGPADGFVQDAQGNILGHEPGQPEDNIYQEVPGGTYQAIDDTQTFFLNEGGTYSASLKVTGNEDVRLRVRDYVASKISGQAVFEVDAPVSAEVGVDFTNIQPLGDLRVEIDQNNDGTIDERRAPNSVVSGPASSETEPPNTTAVVKALGGSRHEITLSAEDGPEGSGVASTHYFVEGGQSEQLYSGPFTVAGGTTVNFYSVDKVGNAESLRKVTVVSDLAIAWGKQFGTSGADFVNGVALAPNGDAHVAGYVRSLVSGSTDASNDDATLGKYLAADGTGLWNKQFGTSTGDVAYDVAVDQQGNTYVVGKGDVVNRGSSGGFIVKYDAQGNTNFSSTSGNVWANQFTSGSVRTVAVDPDDNVYISVNINSDVYVYKYAPNGTLLTSKRFGAYGCYGTGLLDFAFGSTVGTRSDDPSVYVTGITAGQKLDDPTNCNVSSSENGMFLIKFDGTLNKRWDKQFGGPGGDGTPMDLAVDPENNAYVTGYTNNGAQIRDPSASGGLQSNLGGRDSFLFKFSSSGVGQYAKQFGTSGDDLARSIAIGPSQVAHVAGRTTGAFDPTKPNAGGGDVFVTKRRTDDGSEVVSRQFGKAGEDSANGLAYDWSSGKVVVAGTTDGSLFDTPNAGGIDGFVAKVDYNESGGDSDTAAPYAPTIDLAAISDTGSSNTDNLTNNATPKLTGSAEPTSTIKVKDGATLLGTTTTTTAGAWSFSTTTPLSNGAHQLTATATDTANNESAVSATLTVNVDTTVPAPTSPSHAFTTPTQLSPSAVPVLLSWPASSDASGIERYELRQSTDGGSTFTNVALSSQNQTNRSYTAMLATGTTTYLFEARAVDKAGNGSWTRGSGFKVGDYPETSTSVVYAGKGWNAGSATSFFGGTSKYASAASNTATLTFTNAKQVGWVTTVGPSRGNAKLSLYEGTTLLASVTKDTYASALQYRQLLYSRSGLDSTKTYKLVVEVLGTKNTASTSTRVDIDSFVVIR